MLRYRFNISRTIKHPSAWLPIAMSFAALIVLFVHVALYGFVHEADEGTAAHTFQLLMVGQVPIVAFFVVTCVPRMPRQALQVLALQVGAAFAALVAVFFLT